LTTHHRIVFDPAAVPADRVFQIQIQDTTGNLLRELYAESINGFGTVGRTVRDWQEHSFALDDFAGQTVRVTFSYQMPDENFLGFANLELDAISLEVTPVPEPATTALLVAGLAAVGIVLRRRRRRE
jgi:hypothetical protein